MLVYGDFFRHSMAAKLDLTEIRTQLSETPWLSFPPARIEKIQSKITLLKCSPYGNICCHGNQSSDPILPKTFCSPSPDPEMGPITFESNHYHYLAISSLPLPLPLHTFWKCNHYHYHYFGNVIITFTHYFWQLIHVFLNWSRSNKITTFYIKSLICNNRDCQQLIFFIKGNGRLQCKAKVNWLNLFVMWNIFWKFFFLSIFIHLRLE